MDQLFPLVTLDASVEFVELKAGPLFTVVRIPRHAFLELKDSFAPTREILVTYFLDKPVMWQNFSMDKSAFYIMLGPGLRWRKLNKDERTKYYNDAWGKWEKVYGDWSDESLHTALQDTASSLGATATRLVTGLEQLANAWSAACESTWTEYEACLAMLRQGRAEGDDIDLFDWWRPKFEALAGLRARAYPIVSIQAIARCRT